MHTLSVKVKENCTYALPKIPHMAHKVQIVLEEISFYVHFATHLLVC